MNSERWLWESISSLLTQTYKNFELIIIDNNSKDKTLKIIHSFDDDRITIINQFRGQLASALNEGLDNASGKFIARQDADDFSSPDRFSRQMLYLKRHPNVSLAGSYFQIIDVYGKIVKEMRPPLDHEEICVDLLTNMILCGPSILGRKELFDKVGNYDLYFDGLLGEDYDFVVRASEVGKIECIPEFLYFYRTGYPESMCGNVGYNYEPFNKIVKERAILRGNQRFLTKYGMI